MTAEADSHLSRIYSPPVVVTKSCPVRRPAKTMFGLPGCTARQLGDWSVTGKAVAMLRHVTPPSVVLMSAVSSPR